jgi:sterol desaturase/sphingolipid hydroxylase (fatty acid hydroxylase superfamily)
LDFGRFAWLLNAPSYHRLHHSSSPEHFNCNYAASLPLYDVLCGTYRPARPGQWSAVGLADRGDAKDFFDLLFWPMRGPLRAPARRPAGEA